MKLTHTQLVEGITVISFFDGMACGLQALKDAGIKVKAYYAAEIDKPAMQVAKNNHPEIIHIGDVTKVHYMNGILCTEAGTFEIGIADLIIGGSPCQGFSFAGKQLNFEDPRSRLFFEFNRLLIEAKARNPDLFFMLENVRMKQESKDVISQYLGVQPEPINSALFSAQSRPRLYWTNINFDKNIVDKGILLKDILEDNPANPTYLSEGTVARFGGYGVQFITPETEKAKCLAALEYVKNGKQGNYLIVEEGTKLGIAAIAEGEGVDLAFAGSKTRRGRALKGKANCLDTAPLKQGIYADNKVRKLTPVECERLQTMPDNYTTGTSDTQRYKMLGNGWTKDVVQHIFSGMLPEATTAPAPAFMLTYNGNSVKLSEEQQQALEAFAATLGKLKLTVKV